MLDYPLDNGLGSAKGAQSISWGLLDKPVKIRTRTRTGGKGGSVYEEFTYGPGGQRYLRKHADGSKTFYVGDMEYQIDEDGRPFDKPTDLANNWLGL